MNTGPYGQYQANLGAQPTPLPALIAFTIPVAGNPNSLHITTTVIPALAVDTVGDALYVTTNGTTWTAISGGGGGGGTTQVYQGNGNPASTPTNAAVYVDLTNGNIWVWDNVTTFSWEQLTSH